MDEIPATIETFEPIEPAVTVLVPAALLANGETVKVTVQIVRDAAQPQAPKEEARRFIGGPRP